MSNTMVRLLKARRGATAIEYGLMAGLVAGAIMGGVAATGSNVNSTFCTIAVAIGDASSGCDTSADSGSSGSAGNSGGGTVQQDSPIAYVSPSFTSESGCVASGANWNGSACQTQSVSDCITSGGAWNGIAGCQDLATANAAASATCQQLTGLNAMITCDPDGGGATITDITYNDQIGPRSTMLNIDFTNQDACTSAGGSWDGTPGVVPNPGGSNGGWPDSGSCHLTGAAFTSSALACLDGVGGALNPDGTCAVGQTSLAYQYNFDASFNGRPAMVQSYFDGTMGGGGSAISRFGGAYSANGPYGPSINF